MTNDLDWKELLLEQAEWHWHNQLRPRLNGLTDDEYRWEPVDGAWNVRPRGTGATAVGSGDHVLDWEYPAPEPAPVTTIAWRIAHLVVGVYGMRVALLFGGPPMSHASHEYPGDAATALRQLDTVYEAWIDGIRKSDLSRPCGPGTGMDEDYPMAALVLHVHRELIHHGAEIALLRDLYRGSTDRGR
ncbi:DinB family protein [Kutzneria buriramensis]|uniref:DinB family protein n=1 Tax=Kutzneria buriramensis TaxID=1045776 RepID=A0A3E0GW39_9PSEU|nr:DinB family protein [Kutzneria buriramensis]REH30723.1 DinB family protein [Kutzneria buriramensis]